MKNLTLQLITAAVLAIGGMAMLFCGLYIDPQGEIHESLLIGFGEVATFAGSLFGVDYYYKNKYIKPNHDHGKSNSPKPSGESGEGDDAVTVQPLC